MIRVLKIKFSDDDNEKLDRVIDAYDVKTDAEVIRILVRDKFLQLQNEDLEISKRIAMSHHRKVPTCEHYWKKHYSNGLCKYCYDKKRVTIPVTCSVCEKQKDRRECVYDASTKTHTCLKCLENKA